MSADFIPAAVEAVVIRPGDKLLLRYDGALTAEQARTIEDRVSEGLKGSIKPGDIVVIMCDQIAVYRDEAPERTVRHHYDQYGHHPEGACPYDCEACVAIREE
jgi:hypothetical protein